MADVVTMPGVAKQLKLVAGLRWRILRNSMHRKNNRWDLIGVIAAGFFTGLLIVGLCFAFFAGGYAFLNGKRAGWTTLLFWAIFLWWQVFPIFVAGFGVSFDFKKLLRFPMSQSAFYLLSLGYGFADFGAVSSICWIASLTAGAAVARVSVLPVMLLVSILFVLLNVTIERLIGSWIEKVMAKRKAREIFLGIFVLSMISLNLLTPAFQKWGEHGIQPRFLELIPYLSWLPGSLAGKAVAGAAVADLRVVFGGLAGLLVWFVVMSGFLWRRFEAQYFGEEISESDAPVLRKKRERKLTASGGRLPVFLSPQVAGVLVKEFHYVTRNGFAFLTFVVPPIMVFFFSMQFAGKNSMIGKHGLSPQTFFPAIMAYLILILLTPAYNSFAFEGKGIQAYFMSPVRFQDILLGKNLLLVLLVTCELALCLGILLWRVGWPGAPMFAATVTAGVFAVVGQLTIANWSSLSFPKKMELGKMKGQRNSGVAVWTAFGVQIVLGGTCALVLLVGRWTDSPWLPATAFAGLAAAAGGGYVASLGSMSRLAEEKKELLIETLCR